MARLYAVLGGAHRQKQIGTMN